MKLELCLPEGNIIKLFSTVLKNSPMPVQPAGKDGHVLGGLSEGKPHDLQTRGGTVTGCGEHERGKVGKSNEVPEIFGEYPLVN